MLRVKLHRFCLLSICLVIEPGLTSSFVRIWPLYVLLVHYSVCYVHVKHVLRILYCVHVRLLRKCVKWIGSKVTIVPEYTSLSG